MIDNTALKYSKRAELYHIGIYEDKDLIKSKYGLIKAVVMGGKDSRMRKLAVEYRDLIKSKADIEDLAETGGRYSMFKVENILFLSHGMGVPSISIALHEITKLLHYAGAENVIFIRFGTCGGLGLTPGTVVVSRKCLNTNLSEDFESYVCGNLVKRPTKLDEKLSESFVDYYQMVNKQTDQNILLGNTFCANDFYEEQARLDGAINELEESDKMAFLQRLYDVYQINNIEMESSYFGMFCRRLGIRGMVACMTIIDRLSGDVVSLSNNDMTNYESNFSDILLNFIKDL